jgi:hypothetical protein
MPNCHAPRNIQICVLLRLIVQRREAENNSSLSLSKLARSERLFVRCIFLTHLLNVCRESPNVSFNLGGTIKCKLVCMKKLYTRGDLNSRICHGSSTQFHALPNFAKTKHGVAAAQSSFPHKSVSMDTGHNPLSLKYYGERFGWYHHTVIIDF